MPPTQLLSPAQIPSRILSWFPPFANCAKNGAPTGLGVPARSKAGPPALDSDGTILGEKYVIPKEPNAQEIS